MVYGETGIFPLKVDFEGRIISYWTQFIDFNSNRLSNMMYVILHTLFEQGRLSPRRNDYGNIWAYPNDQYLQSWDSLVSIPSSGVNYRIFKTKFELNN